jgi:hypothetical protein
MKIFSPLFSLLLATPGARVLRPVGAGRKRRRTPFVPGIEIPG